MHWLTHPRQALQRVRYYFWEKSHPGSPWLCPGTVRFCEEKLKPPMAVLEFGSGRSTIWFAQRVGRVTSVEHEPNWYAEVQRRLAAANVANVDYRLIPLEHSESEGERVDYTPMPAYVRAGDDLPDSSLDLVVVDGHYRSHCIRRAIPKLKPGGYLLVDDVNFWTAVSAIPVPDGWKVVDDSTNGLKRCMVWQAA